MSSDKYCCSNCSITSRFRCLKGGSAHVLCAGEQEQRAIGVASLKEFNYVWGKGSKSYRQALKAKKAKDWPAALNACQEALTADPSHLDAHRLIASAMAQTGAKGGIAKHLSRALAADWLAWGRN